MSQELKNAQSIAFGICALEKKTKRPESKFLVSQLQSNGDENGVRVITFQDSSLSSDINEWPKCDALLYYHSTGFPEHKAKEYVDRYRPFEVNSVHIQNEFMLNRITTYELLEKSGVSVPEYLVIDHCTVSEIEETNSYISWNGKRLEKPLVEKPMDANNHSIRIYYPDGSCRTLFRKSVSESSTLSQNCKIRRDGKYLYEKFYSIHDGYDVKVYFCGDFDPITHQTIELFTYAELRKSPCLDGVVHRDDRTGLEHRSSTVLTSEEVEMTKRIMIHFKHRVCGFDILRVKDQHGVKSIVCDVNGYSDVRRSKEFYIQCGRILNNALHRHVIRCEKQTTSDI